MGAALVRRPDLFQQCSDCDKTCGGVLQLRSQLVALALGLRGGIQQRVDEGIVGSVDERGRLTGSDELSDSHRAPTISENARLPARRATGGADQSPATLRFTSSFHLRFFITPASRRLETLA